MTSGDAHVQEDAPEKKSSGSTASLANEKQVLPHGDAEANDVEVSVVAKEPSWFSRNRGLVRRLRLFALAALVLGWWISATILRATRHRWIVQTVFAWSFVAIIAFRFIPNSVVTRPVEAVWLPWVQEPFFALPRYVRYGLGWLALLAITLGSAFGFELENGTNYGDRAISVLGLIVFQFGFWATSKHRSHIHWRTVIVGLFMQQAIALFVLKTGAGFNLFRWLANLASDFLAQGLVGAAFFFDQDTVNTKHWFFVNVVRHLQRK